MTYNDGTLEITPITLTVTTESATIVDNGSVLTAPGTIEGLLAKDKEVVIFEVTGKQVGVGSSTNTYKLTWPEVAEADADAVRSLAVEDGVETGEALGESLKLSDNYTIVEDLGTLIINPNTDNPPTDNPPTDNPPTDNPPTDNPPTDNPPTENPPTDNPPTENPPTDNPPTTTTTTTEEVVPIATVGQTVQAVATTTIPDEQVPLAGVLGQQRGIEADDSSVLGQRRAAAEAGVLGARRDAETSDANHMAMYLMLMGIATGVGGAYTFSRRKKRED